MKRTRGEIQVFSVSFLDLLSCALGGILVLWLLSVRDSEQKATSYARQVDSMQQQISVAQAAMAKAQRATAEAQQAAASQKGRAESQQRALDGIKAAQAALIGLNGKMDGAVFIFDTSGSMERTRRHVLLHGVFPFSPRGARDRPVCCLLLVMTKQYTPISGRVGSADAGGEGAGGGGSSAGVFFSPIFFVANKENGKELQELKPGTAGDERHTTIPSSSLPSPFLGNGAISISSGSLLACR